MDRKRPRGVTPKGDRIQLCFAFRGKRFRPTLDLPPTQSNLQHARRRLDEIRRMIGAGTFSFRDEFPDYRWVEKVAPTAARPTFNQIADRYLVSINELEYATRVSYEKILKQFWRPRIGDRLIDEVRYAELKDIVAGHPWASTKTRNNVVSVMRCVFEYAFDSELVPGNPAARLKSLKVQLRKPDPFRVEEAVAIINGIRKDWGEHDANYVEFGFFAGTRPSELISILWPDVDLRSGTVKISKARVMARDKDTTKTAVERDVELCPRAAQVLKRQRRLTQLRGAHVFTREDGTPFHDLQVPWKRWKATLTRLGIRYREPYQMRHTSVTWNLMIGGNILQVAANHGHSAQVMLKTYAKWLKGAKETDIRKIRAAMGYASGTKRPKSVAADANRSKRATG